MLKWKLCHQLGEAFPSCQHLRSGGQRPIAAGGKNRSPARSGWEGKDEQRESCFRNSEAQGETWVPPPCAPCCHGCWPERSLLNPPPRAYSETSLTEFATWRENSPTPISHLLLLFPSQESCSYFRPSFLFTLFLGPRASEADNEAGDKIAESPHLPWKRAAVRSKGLGVHCSAMIELSFWRQWWRLNPESPVYQACDLRKSHLHTSFFFLYIPKWDNNRIHIRRPRWGLNDKVPGMCLDQGWHVVRA